MYYKIAALCAGLFFGSAIRANIITCERIGVLSTGCKINKVNLAQGYGFEINYAIDFRFQCQGNRVAVGFETEGGMSETFHSSNSIQTVHIDGTSVLRPVAIDPESFYRAMVRNCSFEILNIEVSPSFETTANWNRESILQAKIIDKSLDLYKLAKDYHNYREWDLGKTELIHDKVDQKVTAFSRLCENGDQSACRAKSHFTLIRNSLKAKLDATPIELLPLPGSEALTLADHYRGELAIEVQQGQFMLDRYNHWLIAVEANLAEVMAEIPPEVEPAG